MQTRHVIIATLIIIVGLAWSGTASAGPLKKHLRYQHQRIRNGIASGELTHREARHLRRHQQQIRKMRHHFLADGRLTHRERQILNRHLNRHSDMIYASKHNWRYDDDRIWRANYH